MDGDQLASNTISTLLTFCFVLFLCFVLFYVLCFVVGLFNQSHTQGLFTEPGHSSKLKLAAGELLVLTGRTPTQFYSGRCRGETGEFPTDVVLVTEPSTAVPWVQDVFWFCLFFNWSTREGTGGWCSFTFSPVHKGAEHPHQCPHECSTLLDGIFMLTCAIPMTHALMKARATFDFDGQAADELSFLPGDIIFLTKRIGDEWLEGRIYGKRGIFPANFVDVVVSLDEAPAPPPSESTADALARDSTPHAVATYPYETAKDDELSFGAGDVIALTRKVNADWYAYECAPTLLLLPHPRCC